MKVSPSSSASNGMLVRVAERIRAATNVHAVVQCVIAEVGRAAVVFCDHVGTPSTWIGDATFDRGDVHDYLERGYRDDACYEQARETLVAQRAGGMWVAPILGGVGVIGMLRVEDALVEWGDFVMISAYVSIRLALLGIGLDNSRALETLTSRQREVAELVAHGCTNAEIGEMLAISPNAVKKHVSRVLALLDVTNRTELAALTGRWRYDGATTTGDQSLPPSLAIVVRNSAKPVAVGCRVRVA